MCLLIVKPKGVKMPKKSILRKAHMCNPHGCGFASTNDYFKSLDFDTFYDRLKQVDIDEACIIHFRYATHGTVKRSNCHPFRHKDVFFAHNGILPITPYKDKTDSETAFRKFFVPAIENYGLHSAELVEAVESIIGYSKFAFLRDNEVVTFGNFFDIDGLLFSNLRFTQMGIF